MWIQPGVWLDPSSIATEEEQLWGVNAMKGAPGSSKPLAVKFNLNEHPEFPRTKPLVLQRKPAGWKQLIVKVEILDIVVWGVPFVPCWMLIR
jgi:hypothetical protein